MSADRQPKSERPRSEDDGTVLARALGSNHVAGRRMVPWLGQGGRGMLGGIPAADIFARLLQVRLHPKPILQRPRRYIPARLAQKAAVSRHASARWERLAWPGEKAAVCDLGTSLSPGLYCLPARGRNSTTCCKFAALFMRHNSFAANGRPPHRPRLAGQATHNHDRNTRAATGPVDVRAAVARSSRLCT